ncbi:MAG: hypothetical protein H6636_00200 [Anaerolineales bacterium]|nr:hypothetical protein [Anaerolineales bacterium]
MYIDPNTGGVLFQALAVAFGAISGIVLLFSGQIKSLIRRIQRSAREKRGETAEVENPDQQPD